MLCEAKSRRALGQWISARTCLRSAQDVSSRADVRILRVSFVAFSSLVSRRQTARLWIYEAEKCILHETFQTIFRHSRLQSSVRGFQISVQRHREMSIYGLCFQALAAHRRFSEATRNFDASIQLNDLRSAWRAWSDYVALAGSCSRRAWEIFIKIRCFELQECVCTWASHCALQRGVRALKQRHPLQRMCLVLTPWRQIAAKQIRCRALSKKLECALLDLIIYYWSKWSVVARRFNNPLAWSLKDFGIRCWRQAVVLCAGERKESSAILSLGFACWLEALEVERALLCEMRHFWALCEQGNRFAAESASRLALRVFSRWRRRAKNMMHVGERFRFAKLMPLQVALRSFRKACDNQQRVRTGLHLLSSVAQSIDVAVHVALRAWRLPGRLDRKISKKRLECLEQTWYHWLDLLLLKRKVQGLVSKLTLIDLERGWTVLRANSRHARKLDTTAASFKMRRLQVAPMKSWRALACASRRHRIASSFELWKNVTRLNLTAQVFDAWLNCTTANQLARRHCLADAVQQWKEVADENDIVRRRLRLASAWASRRLLLRAVGRWYIEVRCGRACCTAGSYVSVTTSRSLSCAAWRPRSGRGDQLSLWSNAVRVTTACSH